MAALLALRFIWLIGHDALWNPPPCGGPGFRSDASTNKPVLMENAAEMETKPEQELSAKQKALGEVGRTRISTLQFR